MPTTAAAPGLHTIAPVKRITSTAWFGPKQITGWGWTPTSWQGWALTFAWTVVVVAVSLVLAMAHHLMAMIAFEVVAIASCSSSPR
jgi:hypothetical protein